MIQNKYSLKAKIKNIAKDNNIESRYILQSFMFEALLKRIAKSKYKDKFIIKGGILLASIFGVNLRSTMDMDTTIVGLPLNVSVIIKVLEEIINIDIGDNIKLSLVGIKDIREEDIYSGINVHIIAEFDGIKVDLMVDITTGDVITYKAIEYSYKTIFNECIKVLSYNYETVIAEKFESIISRNIDNTRMKDYYDLYMFTKFKWKQIDKDILITAIKNTSKHRNSEKYIERANDYIELIEEDDGLKRLWKEYQTKYNYAKDISFDDIIDAIKIINNIIVLIEV